MSDVFSFPLLIVKEDSGRMWGVLVDQPDFQFAEELAMLCVEAVEATRWLNYALQQAVGSELLGCRLCGSLDAPDLATLLSQAPLSTSGQCGVLAYRPEGWHLALHTAGKTSAEQLYFYNVAEFHGLPAPAVALQQRDNISTIRGKELIPGDYAALDAATALADSRKFADYENHPACRALAGWWNVNAPLTHREVGFARLYWWRDDLQMLEAGDPEEPPMSCADVLRGDSWTLFERPGAPSVVAVFFRGRQHFFEFQGYTSIPFADGTVGYEVGASVGEVNEALYCVRGLVAIRNRLARSGL